MTKKLRLRTHIGIDWKLTFTVEYGRGPDSNCVVVVTQEGVVSVAFAGRQSETAKCDLVNRMPEEGRTEFILEWVRAHYRLFEIEGHPL